MKIKNTKIACILAIFIILFSYIGGLFTSIDSYAQDNTYIALISSNKPSSGKFKNSTKSYSTKPSTTIKPDSGSFSTKPNTNNKNSGSSSTIKPDSGSFSTKPKNNNSSNEYDDYGGSSSSKPIFRGGYYRSYNPFRRVFFGYGISPWIMKLVTLITVIVVIYIIVDYIRSKRD